MKCSNCILCFLVSVFMFSCNKIPNKSIFNELTADELAEIIKVDPSFIDFYEELKEELDDFNEIEKAKFIDITYRNMYDYYGFLSDTVLWATYYEQWDREWESQYAIYEEKVDSVLNYWREYQASHSLSRYVDIKFAEIDKEYYTYSSDVRNVNVGFKLTPLQGTVEQVRFRYRYSEKINSYYGEWINCLTTDPFSREVTRYWEVDYSDERRLKNLSTYSFIRDYDIQIEVTNVRINGRNYSEDDIVIPKSVKTIFGTDPVRYPYTYENQRSAVITELLCPSYVDQLDYTFKMSDIILKEKYPREFTLMEYLEDR